MGRDLGIDSGGMLCITHYISIRHAAASIVGLFETYFPNICICLVKEECKGEI